MMTDNRNVVEEHGCIVCGKVYQMLVVYGKDGKMLDCMVTDAGAHRVQDPDRPIAACNSHSESEIERAMERHYSGRGMEEDEEE